MWSSSNLLSILLASILLHQTVLTQSSNTNNTPPNANLTRTSSSTSNSSSASPNALTAGLSPGCQAGAGGLLTSDFGQCSNIIGLVSVISAQGSVLTPLNSWITSLCSSDPCSDSTLSTASQSINSACGTDAKNSVFAATALTTVITNYKAIRGMLCTQYVSNSTFCVTSVLGDVQTTTGKPLTVAQVASLVAGGLEGASQTLSQVPPSTYCTDCGHALVTQGAAISTTNSGSASNNATSSATHNIAGVCGASFGDNKIPSTVRVVDKSSASANAQNNGSSQDKLSIINLAIVGLVGLVGLCIV